MRVLILADGDAPTRDVLDATWPGWDDDVGTVIAADGGARHAPTLGVALDLWVGDGDSLGEDGLAELAAAGVPIERSRPDKDESDTELAIRAALRRDPTGIVIVGALGGPRIDHALANVGLLAIPELGHRPVVILDARARIGWLGGPRPDGTVAGWPLVGRPGDLVTILPLDHPTGVTTFGLAYPLRDEPLLDGSTRGLSNVVESAGASVSLRSGSLLIIETPATLRP